MQQMKEQAKFILYVSAPTTNAHLNVVSRVRLKPDGTRWGTEGEVKEKLANGVGSQYSHTTS